MIGNSRRLRSRRGGRIHMRSRIGAVRHGRERRSMGNRRFGRHRAFRVEQVIVARPQPQADQRPRIRHRLRLPAVICLIAPHGIFAGLIPRSRRFARHIVLANQCFLNRLGSLRIDLLLPPRHSLFLAALARAARIRNGALRLPAMSRSSFRSGMRCRLGLGGRRRRACSRRRLLRGRDAW